MKFLATALVALLNMAEVSAFTMPTKPAFTRLSTEIKAVRDYVSQDQVYGAPQMGAYNPYQQPQSNVQLALDKLNNVLQHDNRHGTMDNAKARLENVLSQAMASSGGAANEQDFNMLNSVVDSTLQRMNELEILGLMEKLKGEDYGASSRSGTVTTNDYTLVGKNNQYDAWHHTSEDGSTSGSAGGLWSDSLARSQEYRQNTLDPSMNQFNQMNQNSAGGPGGMEWSNNMGPSFSQKETFSKYNQDFQASGNDWWKKQPSAANQPNAGGNFMSSEGTDQYDRWYHPGGQNKKKEEPKKATFQPRSTGNAMGMNQMNGPMPNMAVGVGMNQQMMYNAPMNPEVQNTFVVAKRNSPASSYYNYGGYDNYSPYYNGNSYRTGNWWEHGAERNRKMDYGFGYGNGVSRYGGYNNWNYNDWNDRYYNNYNNWGNDRYYGNNYYNNYYDNGGYYGGYGNYNDNYYGGYGNGYYNSYSPYSYYNNGYGNGYYNNYDTYGYGGYGGYGNGYNNNRYGNNWYNGNGYYNGNSYYNNYSMSPYNRYYNDYSYYGNYNDYYSPYSYNYGYGGYGNGYNDNYGYGGYGNGYYNNYYNNGYGGYGNGYYNNYYNNDWYNGYNDNNGYYNNNRYGYNNWSNSPYSYNSYYGGYGGYGNGYYDNYGYGGYGGYGNGYYNSYSPYSYNSYGYGNGYYGGYGDDWYNGNGYYNNYYGGYGNGLYNNNYYGNSWYGDSDWYGGSYNGGMYSRSGYFLGEPKIPSWNNMKERKMRSKGEEYSYRNRQMAYY